MAAVAVSSAAMAQVTVSGYIHYQYDKDGKAASTKGMNDAGITFSATEDLGNGIKASAAFNIDSLAGRAETAMSGDSNLSLSGGFGTVTLARTRAANFAARGNVFGAVNVKDFNAEIVYKRPDVQVISYTSPELATGLRVSVSTANLLDDDKEPTNLNSTTIGATYTAGPLSLGVQQKSGNAAVKASAASKGSAKTQTEAFVTYNAGVAVIGYGYGSKEKIVGKAVSSYGISVPMGAITFGVEGASRDAAKYVNYGARYALSKRTVLHVANGSYQTNATNSKDMTRVRLLHAF